MVNTLKLQGNIKIKPVKSLNKVKSRFAYKVTGAGRNKAYKGIYKLDSVNVSKNTFTFKKIKT